MGGYCYYLGPEGPRILGYLEHPVDSRQSGFEKGRELALADLPPELTANVPPARFPPPDHDWEWLWRPPEPTPFRAPAHLVARAPLPGSRDCAGVG